MIMLIHILIAITSIVLSICMLVASAGKAERLMKLVAVSSGATIVSGVALIALNPVTLTHMCISGVIFTAFTMAAYIVVRRRATISATL